MQALLIEGLVVAPPFLDVREALPSAQQWQVAHRSGAEYIIRAGHTSTLSAKVAKVRFVTRSRQCLPRGCVDESLVSSPSYAEFFDGRQIHLVLRSSRIRGAENTRNGTKAPENSETPLTSPFAQSHLAACIGELIARQMSLSACDVAARSR